MNERLYKKLQTNRATKLKKACVLAQFIRGDVPTRDEVIIPKYDLFSLSLLERHVRELEVGLRDGLEILADRSDQIIHETTITWLSERFDHFQKTGFGIFTISNLKQFEENVGLLRIHEYMDVPPYAELLLQPGADMAFRHPEYMLARDLSAIYDIFLDAEKLCESVDWSDPPEWAGMASENMQGFGRATIQTCFNLLESFTSGLAKAYLMSHPDLENAAKDKLLDTRRSLKERVLAIPRYITNNPIRLDINKPPLSTIFGSIKNHRDAFVHCEPGQEESQRGYVKEAAFHDISEVIVSSAVSSTVKVIQEVWVSVHDKNGPKWLSTLEEDSRAVWKNLQAVPRRN